jgi:hypothetical protein
MVVNRSSEVPIVDGLRASHESWTGAKIERERRCADEF